MTTRLDPSFYRSAKRAMAMLLVLGFSGAAHAQPVTVTPLLGEEAPANPGWVGYLVRAPGAAPGSTVELSDGSGGVARRAVPDGSSEIQLFWHDVMGRGLQVTLRDPSGHLVVRTPAPSPRTEGPLVFHLGDLGGLDGALHGSRIAPRVGVNGWVSPEGLPLVVTSARRDPRSSERVLPERAAGYASVTLALVKSEALVTMPDPAATALLDWVLGGGTLGITVGRTEDLASPRIVSLVDGRPSMAPSDETARFVDFAVPQDSLPVPGGNAPTYAVKRVSPGDGVAARLVGFEGGALRATRWGAAAGCGLGQVHLLAFDPTAPDFEGDSWVQHQVVDLARDSWERKTRAVLVGNASGSDERRFDATRRLLDPNEGHRWAIGLAALILVLYAVIAGPLTFRRATRRGQNPLRALVELPLWSLGALALIVGIGVVAKGGRARARRLTVIEAGAGAPRGAAIRLRALFASSADALRVEAMDASGLPDVIGSQNGITRVLVLTQGGSSRARLEELRGRPWETMLVREDSIIDLGGQVSFRRSAGADLTIVNGLSRDLLAVVAHGAGATELRFFARIPRGTSVALGDGQRIGDSTSPGPAFPRGPTAAIHVLEAHRFSVLMNGAARGSGDAWAALESASNEPSDSWPEDASALIAELPGGDGASEDSGLPVETNRLLLRVLGSEAGP